MGIVFGLSATSHYAVWCLDNNRSALNVAECFNTVLVALLEYLSRPMGIFLGFLKQLFLDINVDRYYFLFPSDVLLVCSFLMFWWRLLTS